MKSNLILIETTFNNLKEAENLAQILLTKKLAACISFTKIDSMFSWKGKISHEKEILLSIKTISKLYKEVEKTIITNHSYEVPQIIAIKIENSHKNYKKWVNSSLKN